MTILLYGILMYGLGAVLMFIYVAYLAIKHLPEVTPQYDQIVWWRVCLLAVVWPWHLTLLLDD